MVGCCNKIRPTLGVWRIAPSYGIGRPEIETWKVTMCSFPRPQARSSNPFDLQGSTNQVLDLISTESQEQLPLVELATCHFEPFFIGFWVQLSWPWIKDPFSLEGMVMSSVGSFDQCKSWCQQLALPTQNSGRTDSNHCGEQKSMNQQISGGSWHDSPECHPLNPCYY